MKSTAGSALERRALGEAFRTCRAATRVFELHEGRTSSIPSGAGAVERFARQLHMEDAVVDACERKPPVWELYLNGIGEAGDRMDAR